MSRSLLRAVLRLEVIFHEAEAKTDEAEAKEWCNRVAIKSDMPMPGFPSRGGGQLRLDGEA